MQGQQEFFFYFNLKKTIKKNKQKLCVCVFELAVISKNIRSELNLTEDFHIPTKNNV